MVALLIDGMDATFYAARPERQSSGIECRACPCRSPEPSRSDQPLSPPLNRHRALGKLRHAAFLEHVLANLRVCYEISNRLYADKGGARLNDVSVRYTGTIDPTTFDFREGTCCDNELIDIEVILDSLASEIQLAQLKDIVDRHCPGLDMLRTLAPIESSLRSGSLNLAAE